jgi:hypothetical protein
VKVRRCLVMLFSGEGQTLTTTKVNKHRVCVMVGRCGGERHEYTFLKDIYKWKKNRENLGILNGVFRWLNPESFWTELSRGKRLKLNYNKEYLSRYSLYSLTFRCYVDTIYRITTKQPRQSTMAQACIQSKQVTNT